MKLSLMTLGDQVLDPISGTLETAAERHRAIVEVAALADQVGFHGIHIGEHHGLEYTTSAPPVILSAIGERTENLRLSTAVALAANLDPVRAAEDYATVDALSDGRCEVVVGHEFRLGRPMRCHDRLRPSEGLAGCGRPARRCTRRTDRCNEHRAAHVDPDGRETEDVGHRAQRVQAIVAAVDRTSRPSNPVAHMSNTRRSVASSPVGAGLLVRGCLPIDLVLD